MSHINLINKENFRIITYLFDLTHGVIDLFFMWNDMEWNKNERLYFHNSSLSMISYKAFSSRTIMERQSVTSFIFAEKWWCSKRKDEFWHIVWHFMHENFSGLFRFRQNNFFLLFLINKTNFIHLGTVSHSKYQITSSSGMRIWDTHVNYPTHWENPSYVGREQTRLCHIHIDWQNSQSTRPSDP